MGEKTIETRTWRTHYRGDLLLCGSRRPAGAFAGRAACVIRVTECRPMTPTDEEAACYPYRSGLFAWEFSHLRLVIPFPVRGQLGFFEVPADQIITSPST